jgi:type IV secretion system protein VirB1
MIDLIFINMCSFKGVHPETTREIIRKESSFKELAININRPANLDENSERKLLYEAYAQRLKNSPPKDRAEASIFAKEVISKGFGVDLGVMQINSSNFSAYQLSIVDAFDSCKNIRVGTEILKRFFDGAEKNFGGGQDALKAALSAYNTGNHWSGFGNGYVAKFYGKKVLLREDPYRVSMVPAEKPPAAKAETKVNPYTISMIPDQTTEGNENAEEK